MSTQLGCYAATPRPRPGCEFKMLDRSAHSLISQLTIRSQSTEIERIDEYDVLAAMINDTIYSNEQAQLHAYEGFGGTVLNPTRRNTVSALIKDMLPFSCGGPRGRVGEFIYGWAFAANSEEDESQYNYDVSAEGKLDTFMPWPSYFFAIVSESTGMYRDGLTSTNIMFSGTYFQP